MTTPQPNPAQIRKALNRAFDDVTFSAFCFDYFPHVYDQFSRGMRKDEKIALLLGACTAQPTGFERLLGIVREEWEGSSGSREEFEPLIEALEEYLKASQASQQVIATPAREPLVLSHGANGQAELMAIAEHIARQRLVLFVGADLAQSLTGLPSREEVAQGLAQRKGLDTGLSLAQVTQRVMENGQRWEFTEYIRQQLETWDKPPQRFHELLVQLPVETMITTAYDDLLPRAFQQAGQPLNYLVENSQISFVDARRRTLLRLYGELSRVDTLVITEDDHYGLWGNANKAGLLDEVRTLLRRHAVLFVGYNLADPDFNLLWREVLERCDKFAMGAYAIWAGLPATEHNMWQNRRIQLIDAEPLLFLERLLSTTRASPPFLAAKAATPASPKSHLAPSPLAIDTNPFGDKGRITEPRRFFGRDALLRQIFEALGKGSNLSLVGESQIGKSSLLSMICEWGTERLKLPREHLAYLSLQWVHDEEEFYEALCDVLGIAPTRGWRLTRALQGKRYVLCLDEVEKMAWEGFTKRVRSQLRGLADGSDAPLSLVIASRSPLAHLFPDSPELDSPLAGICRPLDIPPFSVQEARTFLQQRLQDNDVSFSEKQIKALIKKSGRHPAKLQELAAKLYRWIRAAPP